MEKVVLDGVELSLEETEKGLIFEKVSSVLSKQNRVVSSISVDGVEMEPEAFVVTGGGSVVEFVSMDVRELVLQSLVSAEEYLPRLRKGVLSVADLLERDSVAEAMSMSLNAMEGMDWLLSAVGRCLSLLGCSNETVFNKFQEVRESLESIMGSVVDSFEAGKTYRPALALREEVPPLLNGLEEVVASLKSQMSGMVQ